MINLTKEKYNELIEFLSDNNKIKILISLVYQSNKSFMLVEDLDDNYYLFEIVSFMKLRDDVRVNLISYNKIEAVLYQHNSMIRPREDFYDKKLVIFFNNDTIGVKKIKVLNSFDEGMEYML